MDKTTTATAPSTKNIVDCAICMTPLVGKRVFCCRDCQLPVHSACASEWQCYQDECPLRCSAPWRIEEVDLSALEDLEAAKGAPAEAHTISSSIFNNEPAEGVANKAQIFQQANRARHYQFDDNTL